MSGVLFEPGTVLVTRGAIAALDECGLSVEVPLMRHLQGDWGDAEGEARIANERALLSGGELGSAFTLPTRAVCLILTSGDRTLTSVLTAEELPVVLSTVPEKREAALRTDAGALSLVELNTLLGHQERREAGL